MMNYREDAVNDKNVINRLSTTSTRESNLCDQLSRLAVVQEEIQPAGLLSRIKSTLFSSHEASIRFPFVTSCTIVSGSGRSRDPAQYFCVRADGRCCLLKPVADSTSPSAIEIASYPLPTSADGYCSASLYLGSRQGSLVAVSLDEGKIILLSVTCSEISLAKTLYLPVVGVISHLCLKDRAGLVELYVGVDKKDVFILPDVRKSDKFAFMYSDDIRYKIKELMTSTMTHPSLENQWALHKKPTHPSPIHSTILLSSRYDPFNNSLDFFANFSFEAIEEMCIIRGFHLPPSARVDSLRRLKSAIENAISTRHFPPRFYPELIQSEVSRLTRSAAHAIESIEYDEQSEKVIIAYDSGLFREIVPIESEVSQYVLTFLSLPLTIPITNKSLSFSTACEIFDGSKSWLNVFACCSIAEAAAAVTNVDTIPPPVTEYLNACISQSAGSPKLLVDKIRKLVQSELVASIASVTRRNLEVKISTLDYLLRCLFLTEKFAHTETSDKAALTRVATKLKHARYILSRLFDDSVFAVRAESVRIECVEDFLNQLGTFFFPPRLFIAELGFMAAAVDSAHDTLARFHSARILVSEEEEKAWKIFEDVEMEISLVVDLIKPAGVPPLANMPPSFYYYQFLLELFSGHYEYEMKILEKLVSAASGKNETISQQLRNTCVEKSIANGDWEKAKKMIDSLPVSARVNMTRLMCTEARIRNELPKVIETIKTSPEMVENILTEIDSELESNFTLSNALQAYNLNLIVKNYTGAISSAMKIYFGLLCPYTAIAGTSGLDESTVFDILDINRRLEWQLKSLVLARTVFPKLGRKSLSKTTVSEIENRLVLVDGLRALYSYTADPIEAILDSDRGGVVVIEVCRNLAAVGLVKLAVKIAKKFSLDIFKSSILPYVELVLKCEKDSSFLPPCRFERESTGLSALLPPVTPSMAFVRSDSTGPVGCGGDQIKAMYLMLDSILRASDIPNWVVLETVEFLYLNLLPTHTCPSFMISIAEERGLWLELLRMHMRAENFREAVRLVECHVRYWKPRVVDGVDPKVRLDVPLLIQLQRALEIVRGEYPDAEWLGDKLEESLEELKSTLSLLSERMIVVNGN